MARVWLVEPDFGSRAVPREFTGNGGNVYGFPQLRSSHVPRIGDAAMATGQLDDSHGFGFRRSSRYISFPIHCVMVDDRHRVLYIREHRWVSKLFSNNTVETWLI